MRVRSQGNNIEENIRGITLTVIVLGVGECLLALALVFLGLKVLR